MESRQQIAAFSGMQPDTAERVLLRTEETTVATSASESIGVEGYVDSLALVATRKTPYRMSRSLGSDADRNADR